VGTVRGLPIWIIWIIRRYAATRFPFHPLFLPWFFAFAGRLSVNSKRVPTKVMEVDLLVGSAEKREIFRNS
jgi:hypothetical protein